MTKKYDKQGIDKESIRAIRESANNCPNDSYHALVLIRDLCDAILNDAQSKNEKS